MTLENLKRIAAARSTGLIEFLNTEGMVADYDMPFVVMCDNNINALIEIAEVAEKYKKEQEEIMSYSSQRTLSPAELALYEALAAFKGE